MDNYENKDFFDSREAAEYLGLNYTTTINLFKKYRIKKEGRSYRISKEDLEKIKNRDGQYLGKENFLLELRDKKTKY